MTKQQALFEYLIRLGDNALILGQRLGEWCGHAHQLESDIALTNVALDQIGQCRMLLTEAGRVEGKGRTEDDLAYFRNENEFRNNLMVEQDNENFAHTIVRQYLFDVYQYHLYHALAKSSIEFLQGFALKSIKEVSYHRKLSGEWMLRLGDGTDESHVKMQDALDALWPFTGELFEMNEADEVLIAEKVVPNLEDIRKLWDAEVRNQITDATLQIPDTMGYMATGGRRNGHHTEYMGYILAEMQALPRSMPDAKW
jgi:ring-1,2-phenylacetyl-CoA epoxidase subunit PaaC